MELTIFLNKHVFSASCLGLCYSTRLTAMINCLKRTAKLFWPLPNLCFPLHHIAECLAYPPNGIALQELSGVGCADRDFHAGIRKLSISARTRSACRAIAMGSRNDRSHEFGHPSSEMGGPPSSSFSFLGSSSALWASYLNQKRCQVNFNPMWFWLSKLPLNLSSSGRGLAWCYPCREKHHQSQHTRTDPWIFRPSPLISP